MALDGMGTNEGEDGAIMKNVVKTMGTRQT
jgi:hypothetical protein